MQTFEMKFASELFSEHWIVILQSEKTQSLEKSEIQSNHHYF